MGLATWSILKFWSFMYAYRRNVPQILIYIIPMLNGAMSVAAELMTQNNASPRTIAVYMPIMIGLEILVFGHFKAWGNLMVFLLTSFQFITLYSASIGIVNLAADKTFILTRNGLVVPVTLMHLGLFITLGSIILYRTFLPERRDTEITEIISSPRKSLILLIYALTNTIAATYLCYNAIEDLYDSMAMHTYITHVSLDLLIRDLILYFSTILILDIESRNLKAEKEANIEKALRQTMRHNLLFRFDVNVTKNAVLEAEKLLTVSDVKDYTYEQILSIYIDNLVHPDYQERLLNKMHRDNLLLLEQHEAAFTVSIKMSPKKFIELFRVSEDTKAALQQDLHNDYIWADVDCSVKTNENGDVMAYFYILNVDKEKQQEEMIRIAAETDALTGLYNRRAFGKNLSEYLAKEGSCGTMFMFDLDFFKQVNDKLGHPKGDELLKEVANILRSTFRSNDLICRIGGDEFCAFAKGLVDKGLVEERAKSLNRLGQKSFSTPDGDTIQVSFSIGISMYPQQASDLEELYKKVDAALYRAKEAGRNCYTM